MLSSLYALTHLQVTIPTLHIENRRLRGPKSPVQGLTAGPWQSQDQSPGLHQDSVLLKP